MTTSDVPTWLATVTREAHVRAGLILYGNTRDLFAMPPGPDYVSLARLLVVRLSQFDVRATWDRVDGLRFEDEAQGSTLGRSVACRTHWRAHARW